MSEFAEYEPRPAGPPRVTPPDLRVEPAAREHARALADIQARREGWEPARSLEAVERELELYRNPPYSDGDEQRLVVALSEGRVLGYGRSKHFEPDADAPADVAPAGWYLAGVVVTPDARRLGVATALCMHRLRWLAARTPRAYYIASLRNRPSLELHERLGFREVTRSFSYPRVEFTGGVGVLCVRELEDLLPGSKASTRC